MKRFIKSEEIESGTVDYASLDLPDFAAESRRVLAEAKDRARELVEEAQRQAADIRIQAQRGGFEEGLAQGRKEGIAQGSRQAHEQVGERLSAGLAEITTLAKKVVDELAGARERLIQEARSEMLGFAVELAGKIVGRAAERDSDATRENLRKVLELAEAGGAVTVLVHPSQLESLRRDAAELVETLRVRGKVNLAGDESVGRGGAKLIGRGGEIDATIATQLSNMVVALRGSVENRGAGLGCP